MVPRVVTQLETKSLRSKWVKKKKKSVWVVEQGPQINKQERKKRQIIGSRKILVGQLNHFTRWHCGSLKLVDRRKLGGTHYFYAPPSFQNIDFHMLDSLQRALSNPTFKRSNPPTIQRIHNFDHNFMSYI